MQTFALIPQSKSSIGNNARLPTLAFFASNLVQSTEFATQNRFGYEPFQIVSGPSSPTDLVATLVDTDGQIEKIKAPTALVKYSKNGALGNAESSPSDAERISKQRVKLLAMKYAGGPQSTEILARLEILNRRMLERSPRVSKEQVAELEYAQDLLDQVRLNREERAKLLLQDQV